MRRTAGAVKFEVTSNDLNDAYRAIRKVDPLLAAAIRKGVRLAAQPVVQAVKASASQQGLEKAAAATTVAFSSTSRQITATVKTNLHRAPYARALEYGSQGSGGGYDRHPVFGRETRVNQPTRPYFWSAVRRSSNASKQQITRALQDVFRTAGL